MRAAFLGIVGSLLIVPLSVLAEPIPDYVLEKDYMNCMGGERPDPDPARQTYCQCIRDNMKNWSLDAYGAVAEQESKASDAQHMPAKLQELAQACMAKAMNGQ